MTTTEAEAAVQAARLAFLRGAAPCQHPFEVSAVSCMADPYQDERCWND